MDWFNKIVLTGTAALSLLVSGYVGYKIHEIYNPQQVTFNANPDYENFKKQTEEYEKKIKEMGNDALELKRDIIKAETNTARAEQREAIARKEKDMKPSDLERKAAELEAQVTILEAQKNAYSIKDEATKIKYEAQLAEKDAVISGYQGQRSRTLAEVELYKARCETVVAKERTERAKLERKLIEAGNGYTLPVSRNQN